MTLGHQICIPIQTCDFASREDANNHTTDLYTLHAFGPFLTERLSHLGPKPFEGGAIGARAIIPVAKTARVLLNTAHWLSTDSRRDRRNGSLIPSPCPSENLDR